MSPVHRLRSESKYVLPLPPASREVQPRVQDGICDESCGGPLMNGQRRRILVSQTRRTRNSRSGPSENEP